MIELSYDDHDDDMQYTSYAGCCRGHGGQEDGTDNGPRTVAECQELCNESPTCTGFDHMPGSVQDPGTGPCFTWAMAITEFNHQDTCLLTTCWGYLPILPMRTGPGS